MVINVWSFVLAGGTDLVECMFCGIRMPFWQDGVGPMTKHRELSPGCPFLNEDSNCGNIPYRSKQDWLYIVFVYVLTLLDIYLKVFIWASNLMI